MNMPAGQLQQPDSQGRPCAFRWFLPVVAIAVGVLAVSIVERTRVHPNCFQFDPQTHKTFQTDCGIPVFGVPPWQPVAALAASLILAIGLFKRRARLSEEEVASLYRQFTAALPGFVDKKWYTPWLWFAGAFFGFMVFSLFSIQQGCGVIDQRRQVFVETDCSAIYPTALALWSYLGVPSTAMILLVALLWPIVDMLKASLLPPPQKAPCATMLMKSGIAYAFILLFAGGITFGLVHLFTSKPAVVYLGYYENPLVANLEQVALLVFPALLWGLRRIVTHAPKLFVSAYLGLWSATHLFRKVVLSWTGFAVLGFMASYIAMMLGAWPRFFPELNNSEYGVGPPSFIIFITAMAIPSHFVSLKGAFFIYSLFFRIFTCALIFFGVLLVSLGCVTAKIRFRTWYPPFALLGLLFLSGLQMTYFFGPQPGVILTE